MVALASMLFLSARRLLALSTALVGTTAILSQVAPPTADPHPVAQVAPMVPVVLCLLMAVLLVLGVVLPGVRGPLDRFTPGLAATFVIGPAMKAIFKAGGAMAADAEQANPTLDRDLAGQQRITDQRNAQAAAAQRERRRQQAEYEADRARRMSNSAGSRGDRDAAAANERYWRDQARRNR